VRKKIAEHMVRSKATSPHVTSCAEVDVTNVVNFREAYKEAFAQAQGFKLTYTPFFVDAVVKSIIDFPTVNAVVDGESTVVKHHINLGMAVAMEDGGLIVPVVKNAQDLNFVGLARNSDDLGRRAKNKKLVPDDISGGTFTITNPGVFGGLWGTPIISQPQVAIFGMGTIQKRVVVVNGMIAIRDMIYITLSYDHRVVDGALSHMFLWHGTRTSWWAIRGHLTFRWGPSKQRPPWRAASTDESPPPQPDPTRPGRPLQVEQRRREATVDRPPPRHHRGANRRPGPAQSAPAAKSGEMERCVRLKLNTVARAQLPQHRRALEQRHVLMILAAPVPAPAASATCSSKAGPWTR
jgi:hypothetical protein